MVKVVHLSAEDIETRVKELETKLAELKTLGAPAKQKRLRIMRQLVTYRKALEDPSLRKDPAIDQEKARKDYERRVQKKLKTAQSKVTDANLRCLGCKRKGHVLKDCRKNKTLDICYKCGATEHTSKDCLLDTEAYPYAVCFNCKKTGHLASSCATKDKKGIYIRGGACFRCKSVWHLAKNCPTVHQAQSTN